MFEMRFRAPIAFLFLLSLAACSPKKQAVTRAPAPLSVVTDDRPLAIPRKTEYSEAIDLFKRKQYAQAEKQIERMLAQRSLSDSDRKFLQRQRDICVEARTGLKRAKVVESPRRIRKPEDSDCGPRALMAALRKMGIRKDRGELRTAAKTTKYGTSLKGLEAAAEKSGAKAEGVLMDLAAFKKLEDPAVACYNGDHYVAVLEVNGDRTVIRDPNHSGEQTVDTADLHRKSGGFLLTLSL